MCVIKKCVKIKICLGTWIGNPLVIWTQARQFYYSDVHTFQVPMKYIKACFALF